ncbi:endonuclease domain-containing protein [Comamonas koreensis]|uniref:Endonuclease domain-containing protein n=1 Tax=Comamonas koreensis TaxID=160825 RepID=A0AAW4XZW1_9BURK|nr:endonuclease domain-containing protein [Comamonas koreensis]MCD2167213.1 endonuclease domain-containing protein [Comamonas koreensis]
MQDNALRSNPLSRKRERAGVRADVKVQQARALRQSPTTAEQLLWRHLRNRQLAGAKFRRQHPLGPYNLDFVCLEHGLEVEVDGGQHADLQAQAYDQQRSAWLQQQGLRVLRFWNHEVVQQTNEVLAHVLQALTPALSRLREREVNTKD